MKFSAIANLGTENTSLISKLKIRLTNIVSLITILVSGLYSSTYLFVLDEQLVGVTNLAFTLSYAVPILLNYWHKHSLAKSAFFLILMVHLFVCTNVYVTKDTGFHLYYFLVPPGAFLLYENKEVAIKIVLSVIALILLYVCENTVNTTPLIALSSQMNHFIYQSVIFVNMVEIVVVMSLFVKQIDNNEHQLNLLATTDSLTGIANRYQFFSQGKTLLKQAKLHGEPATIALIDLDHFKQINDTYGHQFGDTCLKGVAKVIEKNLRTSDLFARYGGEEFIVFMPKTALDEAEKVIERVRVQIAQSIISLDDENKQAQCTISVGLSALSHAEQALKQLISQADNALYQAKQGGRNKVITYSIA